MGRFIVPSCIEAKSDVNVILNNTKRGGDTEEITMLKKTGLLIDLYIISEGKLLFSQKKYLKIQFGESVEVLQKSFECLKEIEDNFAMVFDCYYKDYYKNIPQEHQVIYSDKVNQKISTVLYDSFPQITNQGKHPIVLLAPKIWVSKEINTYVIITNINENAFTKNEFFPFQFDLLNENGDIIVSDKITIYNSTYVIDIRKILSDEINLTETLLFFTLVAKGGGDASCVINTLIKNDLTSSMAVEHSLYPAYYMSGNRDRLREESLIFAR